MYMHTHTHALPKIYYCQILARTVLYFPVIVNSVGYSGFYIFSSKNIAGIYSAGFSPFKLLVLSPSRKHYCEKDAKDSFKKFFMRLGRNK